MVAPSNPVTLELLVELGADTVNLPTDLTLAELAEMRAVTDVPLDLYVEAPDAMGGVVRGEQLADLVTVSAPPVCEIRPAQLTTALSVGNSPRERRHFDRPREGAPRSGRTRVDGTGRLHRGAVEARRGRSRSAGAMTRQAGPSLRSAEWFQGDDEVALLHRVALRSAGVEIQPDDERPIIGIADSSSDLNPCNLPLRELVSEVAAGVREAGGVPMAFPVMSLGEDLMKPTAMLYRNFLSMEVEEYLRSYPLDGVVLLGNCDKSVPGAIMGALSADLPTVVITGGPRPVSEFRGRRVGTGTDFWRAWEDHRAGRLDDAGWAEFERCLSCGLGSCNTMGTATSMAIVTEVLGLSLPGSATIPSGDPARAEAAREAGRRAVTAVLDDARPSAFVSDAGLRNAVRILNACGGSTNAVLHLLAIAGRAGRALTLDDIDALGKQIPVLVDLEPSGRYLVQELDAAGGVPTLMAVLADVLELDALAGSGRTWKDELKQVSAAPPNVATATGVAAAIRPLDDPLHTGGAFAVLKGTLAPDGALLKVSAASEESSAHRGPALVFHGYDDMRRRIDDPELDVTPDTVLVLAGCGPVGVPGMPEWGMIPIRQNSPRPVFATWCGSPTRA